MLCCDFQSSDTQLGNCNISVAHHLDRIFYVVGMSSYNGSAVNPLFLAYALAPVTGIHSYALHHFLPLSIVILGIGSLAGDAFLSARLLP